MALQSTKGFVSWPPETSIGWIGYKGTFTDFNLAATSASQKVAFVFVPPIAGGNLTVTDVCFIASDATSAGNCDVRVETVGADGNPSGSLVSANTNVIFNIASTGVKTATLTASAALTAGTPYAIVFAYSSGTWGIGVQSVDAGNRGGMLGQQAVWIRTNNGSAWTNQSTYPQYAACFGLKLSGGAYANIPGVSAFSAINRTTFNNTTTVRKRGSALTPRFAGTACGFYFFGGSPAGADWSAVLQTTAGSVLATWAADKDYGNYYGGGNSTNYMWFVRGYFNAAVDLTAGTTYDLVLVPGSATNITVVTGSILTADANSIQILPGQADNIQVEIDNAAARTTDATKWPFMGLLFSQLSDNAGGTASGSVVVMSGGIVG